jgi:nucleotide-binding universal stress UspA family protein
VRTPASRPHGTFPRGPPTATLIVMTQQPTGAVIPGPVPLPTNGPILLGTEFGPVSSAAERVAICLAANARVPLLIVHVIDPGRLRLPGGRFAQRVDQARAARQADAAALMERARTAGVVPQLLIWDGDPATCVLEAARAEGAARIVLGSHGRGLLGRVLAGSVSATVASLADCPVDIVRGVEGTDEILSLGAAIQRA